MAENCKKKDLLILKFIILHYDDDFFPTYSIQIERNKMHLRPEREKSSDSVGWCKIDVEKEEK